MKYIYERNPDTGEVFRRDQQMDNDLHEAEINHTHEGMKALMNDFNNYQVDTDRKTDKTIKNLPAMIGKIVSQIEFAQNKIER